MTVPMPAAIVLILCKTVLAGPPDVNAGYTGHENREWATEHSMMVCRRQEVQVYDATVDQGAAPRPFTPQQCWRSALMLGVQWNQANKRSSYRFWRAACPVPIINTITKEIIAWKIPDCGHRDTVRCEIDTAI